MQAIPVFYTPRQVAVTSSVSPSAGKPSHVVASWQRLGVPIAIREPSRATVEDFSLVHPRKYVEDVLAARCDNGFGNRSHQVAASLPWTTGSMVSAARYALNEGGVAVAPCSGFHHAGVEHASGYCTFNGLMVAAAKLHKQGGAKRIGILDCDQHYADGTDEIIRWLGASRWIRHVTAGKGYPRNAKRFLAALPGMVREFRDCDVLIYQAGADPHIDDPLGGFLTDDESRRAGRHCLRGSEGAESADRLESGRRLSDAATEGAGHSRPDDARVLASLRYPEIVPLTVRRDAPALSLYGREVRGCTESV